MAVCAHVTRRANILLWEIYASSVPHTLHIIRIGHLHQTDADAKLLVILTFRDPIVAEHRRTFRHVQ